MVLKQTNLMTLGQDGSTSSPMSKKSCLAPLMKNCNQPMSLGQNHAMVNLAKEYVKHDAYTLKVIAESSEELKAKYGENFEGIRKIY